MDGRHASRSRTVVKLLARIGRNACSFRGRFGLFDAAIPCHTGPWKTREVRKRFIYNIPDFHPGCEAASQMIHGCAAHSWPLQSHLLGTRGGHGQERAQKPSARLCPLEVWPRRAPGWQWSSSPLRQDSACRYDGAHSGKPTKSASAGPVCSRDGL